MTAQKHYIDTVYYDLELTSNVFKTLGSQLFEKLKLGITPIEHAVLDTLSCNEGICQRDLAKLILRDRANTGRILDSLEGKGLIIRFIDKKNNRLINKLNVTEEGKKLLIKVHKKIEQTLENARISITDDEVKQIQVSLKKLRNAVLDMVNMQI